MIQVHDLRCVPADTAGSWADHIALHMRESDRIEVADTSGLSPHDAIHESLRLSTTAYAVESDRNGIIAMFGAAPHPLPGVGIAWMLGTDGILLDPLVIARRTRTYIKELHRDYWLLWNFIDGRNAVSMRWLRWSGFELLGEHTGKAGQPLFTFARTSTDV